MKNRKIAHALTLYLAPVIVVNILFTMGCQTIGPHQILPGDCNRSGKVDMLDLYPVVLAISNGTSNSSTSSNTPLHYPPDPVQMNTPITVSDWGSAFTWDGQSIDYKNADCNVDGRIDREDVEYVMAAIKPMALPNFLQDPIQNLSLKAVQVGPVAGPLIDNNNNMVIEVPFQIRLDPATQQIPSDTVMGLSFTRPVTETADYQVAKTHAYFNQSGVFPAFDEPSMIWGQRFFRQYHIQYPGDECLDATDMPLDVGLFTTTPQPVSSDVVIDCGVTLLDVLRVGNTGHLPVFLHTVNGVLYTGSGENITIQSVECTSDTTNVSLTGFCPEDISIRDGRGDNGLPSAPSENSVWASPDIWVRHAADGLDNHQQLQLDIEAKIYVRVHNRSCVEVKNVKVDFYWTESGTDILNSDLHFMDQKTITSIQGWSSEKTFISWTPDSRTLGNAVIAPCPAITIVAIIDAAIDHAPSTSGNFPADVRNSNNRAANSCYLMGTTGSSLIPGSAILAGHGLSNIWIEQIEGSVSHPLSSYGEIVLRDRSGSNILSGWSGNAYHLTTAASAGGWALVPNHTSGGWRNVTLSSGTKVPVEVSFIPNGTHPHSPLTYWFAIWAEDVTNSSNPVKLSRTVFEITVQ